MRSLHSFSFKYLLVGGISALKFMSGSRLVINKTVQVGSKCAIGLNINVSKRSKSNLMDPAQVHIKLH